MGAKFDIIVNQWQLKVKLGKLHERQENASDEISIGLKSKVKQNQSMVYFQHCSKIDTNKIA